MGSYFKDRSDVRFLNGDQFVSSSPNGPWSLSTTGSATRKLTKTVSGVTLPDYMKSIKEKRSATTPLQAVEETVTLSGLDKPCLTYNGSQYQKSYYYGFSFGTAIPSVSVALQNNAKASCLKHFNAYVTKAQSPFRAQIFAGEIRETLQFLRAPLSQSLKTVSSFKPLIESLIRDSIRLNRLVANQKGPRRLESLAEARRVSKEIANQWLEFRFGILPLMGDINTIIDTVIWGKEQGERQHFYGYDMKVSNQVASLTTNGLLISRADVTEEKAEYFLKTGLFLKDITPYDGFAEYLEESLKDFSQLVPTLWEVTPFSWLVDYFVNVGDIIDSVANLNKIAFSYTSGSLVSTWTLTQNVTSITRQTGTVISLPVELPRYILRQRKVDRAAVSSSIPPITFNVPGTNIKLANITALLIQKLK